MKRLVWQGLILCGFVVLAGILILAVVFGFRRVTPPTATPAPIGNATMEAAATEVSAIVTEQASAQSVMIIGCEAPATLTDPSRGNLHELQWIGIQGSVSVPIPSGDLYVFTATPGLVEMTRSFDAPVADDSLWFSPTTFGNVLWIGLVSQTGDRAWGPAIFLVCGDKIVFMDLSLARQEITPWPPNQPDTSG